ncbi:MAG: carbamoyltransferase HypF, partial [Sulfurimonas sp.]|nr:carbamoyltransferase HypF [Sulfurimonas sp.]
MDIVNYKIFGQVQGVGFRPFIYKLATQLSLNGFVKNNENGVVVEIQGRKKDIKNFEVLLDSKLPSLARIDKILKTQLKSKDYTSFEIIQTTHALDTGVKTALISPDIATCLECLNDIKNEKKYLDYFATNCTNCGPRYSIVKTVPYDRVSTSMKEFKMCESCEDEYKDPLNRRYHAQAISCDSCGPKLSESIKKTAGYIEEGKIVAIKGVGGFHIVCDASNDEVVKKLREFKQRPSKPFAIMCKDKEQVKEIASMSEKEKELLSSKEAPIVILTKETKRDKKYSKYVAPNIDRIACFLPYTPLYHLLFEHLRKPIVATSANLASEPIIIDAKVIKEKLPFVEFVLDFNRDIINGVDDSLVQVVAGDTQMLRLSRGFGPKIIKLPFKSKKKILAVGANAKNAIAFVIDDSIILSPHIGDLGSLKAFEFFKDMVVTFKRFYDFEPDIIVHDKHPNYETSAWAKLQDKELVEVQHHLAHIYATKAEFGLDGEYLGFSFDGTGYGDDGSLWGGEIFLGDKRKYTFKSIKLLGGEKAIKEPRRVALSMLFDRYTLDEVLSLDLELIDSFKKSEIKILHQSHTKNLNAPKSSSVGRMFDAIASFASLLHFQSYEGEAGLICEKNYNPNINKYFEYEIIDNIIDINFNLYD